MINIKTLLCQSLSWNSIRLFNQKRHLKILYTFSNNSPYQNLQNSQFAKQLGLQQQFKCVIQSQKQSQKQAFRNSSTIIILILVAFGTIGLVNFLDKSKWNLIKHKYQSFMKNISLKKSTEKQKNEWNIRHEQILKQIYDQNYKDRSNVDEKFFENLIKYINERYNQRQNIQSIKTSKVSSNGQSIALQFSSNFIYILQNLCQKIYSLPQQKIQKLDGAILKVYQKIVYQQIKPQRQNTKQNFTKEHLEKFDLCLLCYGNLNQQFLGMKSLMTINNNTSLISLVQPNKQKILHRLLMNKQAFHKSLKISRPFELPSSSPNNNKISQNVALQPQSQLQSMKQRLMYTSKQLKSANNIRRQKIKWLQDYVNYISNINTQQPTHNKNSKTNNQQQTKKNSKAKAK